MELRFELTQASPRIQATGVAREREWIKALPAVDPVCAETSMWHLRRENRIQLDMSGSQLEQGLLEAGAGVGLVEEGLGRVGGWEEAWC